MQIIFYKILLKQPGSNEFVEVVDGFIDDAPDNFVLECFIGAKRKCNGKKGRERLKQWTRASSIERPLIVMIMNDLKAEATKRLDADVKIDGSTVDEYRANLVRKLMEMDEYHNEILDKEKLDHDLMVQCLANHSSNH